jgi:nitroreductase
MELHEILKKRKSVRAYEQRPVPREVIDRVLASVLHAPSAGFTQGNEFFVIDTKEGISRFLQLTDEPLLPYTDEDRRTFPTVLVLPLADRSAYTDRYSEPDKHAFGLDDAARWPVPYWYVDAGMASMLILLAAVDEGLAAWFFGISEGEAELLAELEVPDRFKPIGAIGLGYAAPAEHIEGSSMKRKRRGVDELVHHGRW